MSTNFDFLKNEKQFESFAEVAVSAEQAIFISPALSASASRTALEIAVKWMYSADDFLKMPYDDKLVTLISGEDFKDLLPMGMIGKLDYLRRVGNIATHNPKSINKDQAVLALKNLHSFLDFLAYCYSAEYKEISFDDSLLEIEYRSGAIPHIPSAEEIDIEELYAENEAHREDLRSKREEQLKEGYTVKPMDMTETQTRKAYIDTMLQDAGWQRGSNWVDEYPIDEMPNKAGKGYADYVLFADNGLPLAVIEAKRTSVNVEKGRQQAVLYVDFLEKKFKQRPLIFMTNGYETRFWDDKHYPERQVSGIYSKRDLEKYFNIIKDRTPLKGVRISDDISDRYYQKEAIQAICDAFGDRNRRKALLVMATGSGKTRTIISLADVLLRHGWVKNLLFLADRNALVTQAKRAFHNLMPNLSLCNLTEGKEEANARAVFSTYQTMINCIDSTKDDKGDRLFSTGHFDLIIVDEAHRTQYGFNAKLRDIRDENNQVVGQRIAYGFAKYMRDALPNATFIGFTGTPVEKQDANTPAVFGNYIDIYDIAQAVEDKVTVKIYYESRLAKVNLTEEGKKLIEEFDRELEEVDEKDEAKAAKMKWAKLEAIVGNKERLATLAKDIVMHFEDRQKVFEGKAMIVAMSRRIAVDLYNDIIKLRPEWHNDDLDKGVIKVIMTSSSSDGPEMQKHHTTKEQRKILAQRMKDENDPLKIVIVRDMWLTGFDVPCLNTMYIDKPMKDHNLMQAIARVNRVFKDKPGGLIVDYIGIAPNLKKALSFYAESGGKGVPAETQARAVEIMLEKLEVVRQILHRFDYSFFFNAEVKDKLSIILHAEDFILSADDKKVRFIKEVTLLSQAYALAKPDKATVTHAEEIAFFQAVKARLTKFETNGESGIKYESVIKNIVDSAIASDEVVDIFDAAGIEKPELSILSDEFLMEIKGMKHRNVAIELLKKILSEEIKVRSKYNLTKSKSLMEMLSSALKRYQNNLLTTAEIIEELIRIAKEIKKADRRGEELGLSEDELAFYDALETNDSAVKVLGDETLRTIARELADKVRKNATIDWTLKESVRAKLMVLVRRTLNKYGYPPDKQRRAVETVMKQAENLADIWASQGVTYETNPMFGLSKVAEEPYK